MGELMKVLVQRVISSEVKVDGKIVGQSGPGLLLFVGFTETDTSKEIDYMVDKVINLRIFDDETGVMNRSLLDINGSILSISSGPRPLATLSELFRFYSRT